MTKAVNRNAGTQVGTELSGYHTPVMLHEVIEGLAIHPNGIYVDCTFGGGGHAKSILAKLGKGTLLAFDQDEAARQNVPDDNRVIFVPHNFRHLQRFLRLHHIAAVDGIIADLGVSSYQFDEAERGFSTRFEGDLDMRMDHRQPLKASDVVITYPEERLHKIFEQYGEITNARTLARTIVDVRRSVSLKTILNFKTALSGMVKGNPNKYFAQVFQALRIEVNDELGALQEMLQQAPLVLNAGGRIAIITFHSLEDRMVKNFFKQESFEAVSANPFEQTVTAEKLLRVITRKPVVPSAEELQGNSRSRSAKLRIAERVSSK